MDHKSHSKHQSKDQELLKEIADLGLTSQNQFLVEKGFTRLKRNIKYLKKFDKDQEKALKALEEKNASRGDRHLKRKHGKENSTKWEDILAKSPYQSQHVFLVSKGFTDIRKNLKKLEKFNGDQEKALEALVKRLEKFKNRPSKEEKEKRAAEEILKLGFSSQNEILVSKGYTKSRMNLKLLIKTNGDIEKTLKKIAIKTEKKELRRKLKENMTPDEKEKKKKDREEKKRLKEELKPFLLEQVPSEAKVVYLDGNNMLFVDDNIRKLCLKHKGNKAENLLADLAVEVGKQFGFEKVILIFDNTKNVWNKNFGSLDFTVCSANPNFKTSDDALVGWMDGLSAAIGKTLIVTSDVGLQIRLREKGVKMLMKSGAWFKVMKQKLGEEVYKKMVSLESVELDEVNIQGLTLGK